MRAIVLTYHSHNISGTGYASNDHAALASDLRTLTARGARIVPLSCIVEALLCGMEGPPDEWRVGLTFDDGPVFDVADFVHPTHGSQRSFLNVMRDFVDEAGTDAQPGLHATSFVIASPQARAAMERAPDCGYPDQPGWLGDSWWAAASTGMLAVGNHSWDHVHHAVERTAILAEERDNFARVDNYIDADREIRRSADFIRSKGGVPCHHFAYPFGHVNRFLVEDYMPSRIAEHRMAAAFGVDGRPVARADSIWNIPRAVCGHHWKSPAELVALLTAHDPEA